MQRIGDIELDQDLDFEERQWKVQRVGWAIGALLIVAALVGVFGSGPLSSATAGNDQSLVVHHERFIRHTGDGDITLVIAGDQAVAGEVEFWVDANWLGAIQILGISPEPVDVRADGDRQIYVFAVDDPAQAFEVSIRFTPRQMGFVRAEFGVNDGAAVSFTQFSYP